MTTKTAPTREQIEREAAALAAQVAEFQQQDQQRADEEYRRRLEAQEKFDQQLVAGYSDAHLEAEVNQARAALDDVLAQDPLVLALAGYRAALLRRSHGAQQHMAALGRLGRPVVTPQRFVTELADLNEYVIRVADRLASVQVEGEIADLHARRDAAGDGDTA